MSMQWNVKIDFCADGSSYTAGAGMTYLFFPKACVETSRILSEDERREINNAIVKAAAQEMSKIAGGAER